MLLNAVLFFAYGLGVAAVISDPTPTPTPVRQEATATPAASTSSTSGIDYFTSTEVITIKGGVTNNHVTLAPQTIEIAIPTCVQTITPDKNGYVPPGTCNALWDYYPSFGAALVFTALFGILVSVHIWQAAAYKKVEMS